MHLQQYQLTGHREITIVTRLHVNRTRTKETCRTSKPEQAEIQRSGAEGPDVARSMAAKFRLQQNVPPDDDVTVDTDTGDVPVPPTVSPRGQRGGWPRVEAKQTKRHKRLQLTFSDNSV